MTWLEDETRRNLANWSGRSSRLIDADRGYRAVIYRVRNVPGSTWGARAIKVREERGQGGDDDRGMGAWQLVTVVAFDVSARHAKLY